MNHETQNVQSGDARLGRSVCIDGERLRRLRSERGLTRERLALASRGADAVSAATLKRAERGMPIYPGTAAAIARALGVELETLVTPPESPTSGERPISRIAVAALPFVAIDGEERMQVFADGLVEEITHRLSGSWFPVIARCSSFSFRNETWSAREIGLALEADYLVEGSVRMSGGRVRVMARLVDIHADRQIWSTSFDEDYTDLFAIQDRLAAEIVSHVGGRVLEETVERSRRREPSSIDAYELSLQGLWHFHRGTEQDNHQARKLVQEALQRDVNHALAWYVLTLSHQYDLLNQWTRDPRATLRELRESARRFEAHFPSESLMHVAAAYALVAHGDRDEASARLEQALDLNPNSFAAHSLYGQTLAMANLPDQGLHELDLARRLSPRDPRLWTVSLTTALAHFAAQRYTEAVHWAELTLRRRPRFPFAHMTLAAAYAQHGDVANARDAMRRAAEHGISLKPEALASTLAATDRAIAERFADGLRRAAQ